MCRATQKNINGCQPEIAAPLVNGNRLYDETFRPARAV
jgi:hypothetical protein